MPAGFNLFIVDKLPGVCSAAHAGGFLAGLRLETAAAENADSLMGRTKWPRKVGNSELFLL